MTATQTQATANTVTLRCVGRDGRDLATPVTLNLDHALVAAALRAVVGDQAHGAVKATRFAQGAFEAGADLERTGTARDRFILKTVSRLDRLALSAVTRDIPATITW